MEDKTAVHVWPHATPAGGKRIDPPDRAPGDRAEPALPQLSSLAEWRQERAAIREARNASA